jgi:hypothetical protein
VANVVRQLPLNPDMGVDGLAAQVTGFQYPYTNNLVFAGPLYINQTVSPVVFTRNSEGVTQNPVNADFSLDEIDEPAFGDLGIQVGPSWDNEIGNSDMRLGTGGYTTTDAGAIITAAATEDSGISESDTAYLLTMANTTGSVKTVTIYQSISGGLINEHWTAQCAVELIARTGNPFLSIRVFDNTNTQLASSVFAISEDGVYRIAAASLQLTAGSSDLRWELHASLEDTEALSIRFTNASLAKSYSYHHYVPSPISPTTRDADVVTVGALSDPFYTQATDEMWSVDFRTLGTLATVANASQLQYILSSYNGVNGTNLFVDDPNTITWQADFNGTPENVTIALGSTMGATQFRAYFRVLTNGGSYDRQLFLENLATGDITASSILTTANLPIQGYFMKLGRDDSDANYFDGFLGRLTFWGNRSNASMDRINSNWPA